MAHFVAEGHVTTSMSSPIAKDTKLAKWLKENKLQRLAEYIHSQEVDLDELSTYSAEMIEFRCFLDSLIIVLCRCVYIQSDLERGWNSTTESRRYSQREIQESNTKIAGNIITDP